MSGSHTVELSKQTLPQLQDLLQRQETLMRNKKLLQALKDKGESVVKLHERILKEIRHRSEVDALERNLSNLTLLNCDVHSDIDFLKEKHVQYVCEKEKPIDDSRYRPHRTLVGHTELATSTLKRKTPQTTSAYEPKLVHQPTRLIPLTESLTIECEHAHRILEEKAKKAMENLIIVASDEESSTKDSDDDDDDNDKSIEAR